MRNFTVIREMWKLGEYTFGRLSTHGSRGLVGVMLERIVGACIFSSVQVDR